MSLWTIKIGGDQKSLSAWKFKNALLTLQNQALDTLTFFQPIRSILNDPEVDAGGIVELYRGETRWFYGRAEAPKLVCNGSIGYEYKISGPWWWLEHMGFRQKFKFRTRVEDETLEERYSSYCILGTKIDGTQQSVRDQIHEAVNYAIEQDAPIALEEDSVDAPHLPTIFPPSYDAWNSPVAEVIRSMCATVPDIVSYFDYSTAPYPTLRFRRRASALDSEWVGARMTAVSIPFNAGMITNGFELNPREDLQVPGVVIYYLASTVVNGLAYSQVTEDIFPEGTTGREPKALVAAFNLEASSINYTQATILCPTIEASSADWWRARLPQLTDPSVQNLSVVAGSVIRSTGLFREFRGQWANWMGGQVVKEVVRATVSYSEMDAETPSSVLKTVTKPVSFELLATDLESGTKNSLPSGVLGEGQPVGLAEAVFKAASVLQYDGTIPIQEDQCSNRVGLGNVLNVTGGRTEWTEMNAQIYSVRYDIDTGKTMVSVGPSKHLGPDDYMELLRASRSRFRFAPPAARSTGVGGVGGTVFLGDKLQGSVPGENHGFVSEQTWKEAPLPGEETPPGSINFKVADCGGKAIAIRRVITHEMVNGVCQTGSRYLPCSDFIPG